jgi:hypothetical protein
MERRNCVEVIKLMLKEIPLIEENFPFISQLKWNLNDAYYKAPEENIQWIRTSETLQKFIPTPNLDWHFQVLSIFTTKSVDQIKEMIK